MAAWCSWLASAGLHALLGVGSLMGATRGMGASEGARVDLQWAGSTPLARTPEPPPPPPRAEEKNPEEPPAPMKDREWTLGVSESDAVTSTWVGVAPEWAGDAAGRLAEVEQAAFALPEGSRQSALGASGSPGGAPAEMSLAASQTGNGERGETSAARAGATAPEKEAGETASPEERATPTTAGKIEKQDEAKSAPTQGERETGANDARGEREGLEAAKKDDGGDTEETLEKKDATTLPPVTDLESRGTAKEPTLEREERADRAQEEKAQGAEDSAGQTDRGEAGEGATSAPMPPGQGGEGGGVVEISTQGQVSDKESEATAMRDRVKVTPGQPVAAKGLEIKTRRPAFSLYTRVTAAPRNAVVRVRFTREGKVAAAEVLRSSGVADVDRPILDAIYGWSASGKRLLELPETREGERPATVAIVFEIVLR